MAQRRGDGDRTWWRRSGGVHVAYALVLVALIAGMTACSSPPPPSPISIEIPKPSVPPAPVPPTQLRATISAADSVNPDRHGRPSPVVVKVFELKSLAAFDAADFFSLFERDAATLGPDLNARDDFVLTPGTARTIERRIDAATRHLAIVAAYRDLEGSLWRASAPVHPNQQNNVAFRIDAARIGASFQAIPQAVVAEPKATPAKLEETPAGTPAAPTPTVASVPVAPAKPSAPPVDPPKHWPGPPRR